VFAVGGRRRSTVKAIIGPVALLDAQEHALAINVSDLQGGDFADVRIPVMADSRSGHDGQPRSEAT